MIRHSDLGKPAGVARGLIAGALLGAFLGVFLFGAACGPSSTYSRLAIGEGDGTGGQIGGGGSGGPGPASMGGAVGTGGVDVLGTGGATGTGGVTGTGAATGTGGVLGSGGSIGSGGALGAGGMTGSGGAIGAGGAIGTGGLGAGGVNGQGGRGGRGTGGAGGVFAGTGGVAGGTGGGTGGVVGDAARYNFEAGAQGWAGAVDTVHTPVTTVATSTVQRFAGMSALAGTLNLPAGGSSALLNPAPVAPIPAATMVTYHVFVPAGALVDWVQPYVQEAGSFVFTGTYHLLAVAEYGNWVTLTVLVPANSTMIATVGVEFHAAVAWTGTVYVDSVTW